MLESYIVIGLVISIVELIKTFRWFQTDRGRMIVPMLVFIVAGLVNAGNEYANIYFYGVGDMANALKEGLTLGAVSGGLYSMGKNYLDESHRMKHS